MCWHEARSGNYSYCIDKHHHGRQGCVSKEKDGLTRRNEAEDQKEEEEE